MLVEDHRLDYNHCRPHSALGYVTPAAFAASWKEQEQREKEQKECREYTACGEGLSPPEDTGALLALSSGGGAKISRKLS